MPLAKPPGVSQKLFVIDVLDESSQSATNYPFMECPFAEVVAAETGTLSEAAPKLGKQGTGYSRWRSRIWNNVKQSAVEPGSTMRRIVETSRLLSLRNMSMVPVGANAPTGGQNAAQCVFAAVQNGCGTGTPGLSSPKLAGLCSNGTEKSSTGGWITWKSTRIKPGMRNLNVPNWCAAVASSNRLSAASSTCASKNASTFWDKQVVEKLYFSAGGATG